MPRSTLFPSTTLFRSWSWTITIAKYLQFRKAKSSSDEFSTLFWQSKNFARVEIGRAVQQECRDLHSFPPRRSSDLGAGQSLSPSTYSSEKPSPAAMNSAPYFGNPRILPALRSEERFSRNAEIYTLSLHDALPILELDNHYRQVPTVPKSQVQQR